MKLFLNTTAILLIAAVASAINFPRNCEDIQQQILSQGHHPTNGIYKIFQSGITPNKNEDSGVEVFCDMETDGGGWIVIQRRRETDLLPQLDFYRNWAQYSNGFGHLSDSFWLGLDIISGLTTTNNYKLRIDLMDWEGEEQYAEYSIFKVENSSHLYRLTVDEHNGTAIDSFSYHSGMAFTTKDNDNDFSNMDNCAQKYYGGWWYKACHQTNLNGLYGSINYGEGLNWNAWHGFNYSLKRTEMKIRLATQNKS